MMAAIQGIEVPASPGLEVTEHPDGSVTLEFLSTPDGESTWRSWIYALRQRIEDDILASLTFAIHTRTGRLERPKDGAA